MYRIVSLPDGDGVQRISDGAVIPPDTANADWRAYQAWLSSGNTPDPYEAPAAPVPASVSNFQGRTVLRIHGLFDTVQAAIDAIGDPLQKAIAQDAFDRGDFDRESTLLNTVLTNLGHDEAFRDALFVEAAAIKV